MTATRPWRPGEEGYALVAAVVGAAAFAYVAFTVLAVDRGSMAGLRAQAQHARLEAAADAGVALTLYGLATEGAGGAWSIDRRPRRLRFDGVVLTVVVEDEYGKIPLGRLTEEAAARMFSAVAPSKDDGLTDAFLDWTDDDDEPRANGAEGDAYAAAGRRPRDGRLRTLEELAEIRGFDGALLAALAPAATVWNTDGPFLTANAHPLALATMSEAGEDSPEVIQRRRELGGQRPVLDTNRQPVLTGRLLTIRVRAEDGQGGAFERSVVAALTGRRVAPYVVRQLN